MTASETRRLREDEKVKHLAGANLLFLRADCVYGTGTTMWRVMISEPRLVTGRNHATQPRSQKPSVCAVWPTA
jgi:hypothetical protein